MKVPKILPRWVPLIGAKQLRAAGAGDRGQPRVAVPRAWRSWAGISSASPGTPTCRSTIGDEAEDLLSLIQEEVRNRRFAEVVRIEVHCLDAGLAAPAAPRRVHASSRSRPRCSLTAEDLYEVPGLMDAADLLSLATLDAPELRDPVVPPGHQPAAGLRAEHLRRDPRRRHPAPPPVRQLRDLGRALHPDRRRRPRRAGDQADALPHRWRQQHRAGAGAGGRARQAGGGADRAPGAVRRGEQHHLGPAPGGRRRPRELRRAPGSRPTPR